MEGGPLTRGEVARVLSQHRKWSSREGSHHHFHTGWLWATGQLQFPERSYGTDKQPECQTLEVLSDLSHGHSTGEAGTLLPSSRGSVAAHTHTPSVLERKAHR